jgi:hypothetical protein
MLCSKQDAFTLKSEKNRWLLVWLWGGYIYSSKVAGGGNNKEQFYIKRVEISFFICYLILVALVVVLGQSDGFGLNCLHSRLATDLKG